jgi:hypothetical protein
VSFRIDMSDMPVRHEHRVQGVAAKQLHNALWIRPNKFVDSDPSVVDRHKNFLQQKNTQNLRGFPCLLIRLSSLPKIGPNCVL